MGCRMDSENEEEFTIHNVIGSLFLLVLLSVSGIGAFDTVFNIPPSYIGIEFYDGSAYIVYIAILALVLNFGCDLFRLTSPDRAEGFLFSHQKYLQNSGIGLYCIAAAFAILQLIYDQQCENVESETIMNMDGRKVVLFYRYCSHRNAFYDESPDYQLSILSKHSGLNIYAGNVVARMPDGFSHVAWEK